MAKCIDKAKQISFRQAGAWCEATWWPNDDAINMDGGTSCYSAGVDLDYKQARKFALKILAWCDKAEGVK